jgi:hypothetical protein
MTIPNQNSSDSLSALWLGIMCSTQGPAKAPLKPSQGKPPQPKSGGSKVIVHSQLPTADLVKRLVALPAIVTCLHAACTEMHDIEPHHTATHPPHLPASTTTHRIAHRPPAYTFFSLLGARHCAPTYIRVCGSRPTEYIIITLCAVALLGATACTCIYMHLVALYVQAVR